MRCQWVENFKTACRRQAATMPSGGGSAKPAIYCPKHYRIYTALHKDRRTNVLLAEALGVLRKLQQERRPG